MSNFHEQATNRLYFEIENIQIDILFNVKTEMRRKLHIRI